MPHLIGPCSLLLFKWLKGLVCLPGYRPHQVFYSQTGNVTVSLIVSDGKLCCASAGATPLVLKQIEAGREYGVRVVVDLVKKNARVFVDGQVVAGGVSLLNHVATLDYVLISTGKQAQGDLYLPVVNVHIGYAVNESFLTAAAGGLPHDWDRVTEAGTVNVEEFKCSARPDVFSLRLADGGKA